MSGVARTQLQIWTTATLDRRHNEYLCGLLWVSPELFPSVTLSQGRWEMGYATRTIDWDVAGLAGIGYVEGVGADVSFFRFRSQTARVEEAFVSLTAAAGVSLGAGQVGAMDSAVQQMLGRSRPGSLACTPIDTLTEFSFWVICSC